jgi:pimeloyl-ACP methyl ester carboxylesterase
MKHIMMRLYGTYLNVLAFLFPALAAKKGFLLFCKPFRQPINDKQKTFFNSGDKFVVNVDSISIQGYRWGTGSRKILFLHGWQSHTYRWKAYIESVPKHKYTVYSIDAPGHGLSDGNFLSVPLYSQLIDSFIREHGPFDTVVGHSLGGFSLLYTLYKFPLLGVNRIILLAPPGEAKEFISVFKNTLRLNDRTVRLVLDHFISRYDVGPEYFSTQRFADSLNVPGLIIHDEEDDEAPHHHSISLQQKWKKSRLVTTKGFGHNLRSPSVVEEVLKFIEQESQEPVLR